MAPPKPVKEGINKADAEAAKKKLEAAGAKAEVKDQAFALVPGSVPLSLVLRRRPGFQLI